MEAIKCIVVVIIVVIVVIVIIVIIVVIIVVCVLGWWKLWLWLCYGPFSFGAMQMVHTFLCTYTYKLILIARLLHVSLPHNAKILHTMQHSWYFLSRAKPSILSEIHWQTHLLFNISEQRAVAMGLDPLDPRGRSQPGVLCKSNTIMPKGYLWLPCGGVASNKMEVSFELMSLGSWCCCHDCCEGKQVCNSDRSLRSVRWNEWEHKLATVLVSPGTCMYVEQ